MELHRIAIHALFVYAFLLGLLRLSGKRAVAEGTPFAFVLALVLGDLVDDALWAEVPLAQFAVGAGTLGLTHLLVSWAAFRSRRLDAFLGGTPTLVLADGRPQPRGLREERMHEQELAFEVRQEGIEDGRWSEIRTMHIEANGAPALVKADWARPVRRSDI